MLNLASWTKIAARICLSEKMWLLYVDKCKMYNIVRLWNGESRKYKWKITEILLSMHAPRVSVTHNSISSSLERKVQKVQNWVCNFDSTFHFVIWRSASEENTTALQYNKHRQMTYVHKKVSVLIDKAPCKKSLFLSN